MLPSVGERLQQARQSQGLSLGEMARQLKLSVKQVEALERNDYRSFPGALWVRGFLRNYAKALGLDAEDLVAKAGLSVESKGESAAMTPTPAEPARERRRMLMLTLGFIIVGLFVLGLLGQRAGDRPAGAEVAAPGTVPAVPAALPAQAPIVPSVNSVAPSSSAPATKPATVAPAASLPVPATVPAPSAPAQAPPASSAPVSPPSTSITPAETPATAPATATSLAPPSEAPPVEEKSRTIRFTFSQSVDVGVRDSTGKVLLGSLQAAGTEKSVRGIPPFKVYMGNVNAVKYVYRGREVDPGASGRTGAGRVTLK
ncbi:MAG: helix-turn-helix domain-containing protein [Acidobacteria bacterium]|nr:helix-turn-helix domain-containing protein [Acidobacteriota bacterium]